MKKVFQTKKYYLPLILLLLVVGVFGVANISLAGVGSYALDITKVVLASPILIPLTGIFFLILAIVGSLDTAVIAAIGQIASYNNFVNEASIITAWAIIRDLSNMFFILIFLVIAFATILRIESYQLKKLLPKLIIVAVLINFSKTICGLIIDFTQVIMLTFVGTWSGNGGGIVNLVLMQKFFSTTFENFGKENANFSVLNVIAAGFIGVIFMIFVGIVLVATLGVFLMRIVMLWIYIVLSPLAFILSAIPAGQKYASQWWGDFIKYAVSGPILAFFIWMAMVTVEGVKTLGTFQVDSGADFQCAGESDILCMNNFLPFILSLAFLIGGLMITQKVGGVIGGIAGKALDYGKKGSFKALTGDNVVARKFAKYTGVDWRPVKLAEYFKGSLETSRKKDETDIRNKAGEHLEAGGLRSVLLGQGSGEDYFNKYTEGFFGLKGLKTAFDEVTYNPFARKHYNRMVDGEEADKEKNIADKDEEMKTVKNTMDTFIEKEVGENDEYKTVTKEERENNSKIVELEKQKKQGNWDNDKKEELVKLVEKSKELSENTSAKKRELSDEARKKFLESPDGKKLGEIEAKIVLNEKNLKDYKDKLFAVQKPIAFESRSVYRKDVEEAKAKYRSITNSDELVRAFVDAQQRGDKFDQFAIMEKLTSDANMNELLKFKGYSSTGKGLEAFIENEKNINGKNNGLLGRFSDRDKLQLRNDIAEAAERVGHWDMAKMVGMNSRGEMESLVKPIKNDKGEITGYDDSAHAKAAYAEILKMDPQVIANKLNRLAYGGEDGDGVFKIGNLGSMLIKYLASTGTYKRSEGRFVGNTAANLISPGALPTLKKILASIDQLNRTETMGVMMKKGATSDGGSNLAGPLLDQMKKDGFFNEGK